jgi:hypothetical protein
LTKHARFALFSGCIEVSSPSRRFICPNIADAGTSNYGDAQKSFGIIQKKGSHLAGSVNKVIIVGNLGADPDVRNLSSGQKIANLRMVASTDVV